ncbi:MAG: methyltransferase domain-containing protein [Saprospiraceae bacterium]|nr:methyltransferase domain-containing protein [Saprospiraceae bacterium]
MNYKLLFPTYRNRYLFASRCLKKYGPLGKGLNLGTGEGDYDPMVAAACQELVSCDINARDVAFAERLNEDLENVRYQVEDALELSFPDNSFDFILSIDVMEHVGKPARMLEEITRVLKPGGYAFISFPQYDFPWTYDPINKVLRKFTGRKIMQGAHAFGHEYLIKGADFRQWAADNKLEVVEENNLSGHLVALSEMYYTGWIQAIFKDNAGNHTGQTEKKMKLRPSLKEPGIVKLTDAFIWLDQKLFGRSNYSVGKGFVVYNPNV